MEELHSSWKDCTVQWKIVKPFQRQGLVMSLAVGIQGQKAYGLCKIVQYMEGLCHSWQDCSGNG